MRTYFTLLSCLAVLASAAQKEHFNRCIVTAGSTVIQVENHFIWDKEIKYSPVYIKTPLSPIHLFVYGEELRISVRDSGSFFQAGQSWSQWFLDSTKADFPFFDRKALRYCIREKGVVQEDWMPATGLLYDKRLAAGDSVSVSFRSGNGPVFLTYDIVRPLTEASPPYCTGIYEPYDKDVTLPQFVQLGIEVYRSTDALFYEDWPEYFAFHSDDVRVSEDTKTAYFFRPRKDAAADSILEYRLLANGHAPRRWQKSGNVVFVYGLRPGTRYQLEVRYADQPGYVYKRKFYVDPKWYQTIWFRIAAFSLCSVVVLLLVLFLRYKRQRRLTAEREGKLRALYAQLNPHFVFNALGSIQGLLNEGEVEKANIYLSDFGKLLRDALDNSDRKSVTLQEEVRQVETYVTLEQLRRPFNFALYTDATLNLATIEVLPLFFQPIIENAIRHGHRSGLVIEFTLRREGADMIAIVEDNGIGFDVRQAYPGRGLKLVSERIALFNRLSKTKKMQQIINSDAKGTVFCVKFTNWLADD